MTHIRLKADEQAVTVLIAATFAFKADELDSFINTNDTNHVATWNRYIDHAHMFLEHLTNNGFVQRIIR